MAQKKTKRTGGSSRTSKEKSNGGTKRLNAPTGKTAGNRAAKNTEKSATKSTRALSPTIASAAFDGAKEITISPKRVAVRGKRGRHYPNTPATVAAAENAVKRGKMKSVTFRLK